jgi:hypothetical protein
MCSSEPYIDLERCLLVCRPFSVDGTSLPNQPASPVRFTITELDLGSLRSLLEPESVRFEITSDGLPNDLVLEVDLELDPEVDPLETQLLTPPQEVLDLSCFYIPPSLFHF